MTSSTRAVFLCISLVLSSCDGRVEEKSLKVTSEGFEGDGFGYDVDATLHYMVIGIPNDIANGKRETGSAIIYPFHSGTTVGDGYKIVPPGKNLDRYFGRSVAISNDHVIVGSRYTNQTGQLTGSAYIYKRRSAHAWGLETTLVPRDGAAHDGFGYDVDIFENYAVVSSFKDDDNGWNSGSVYVFKYEGGAWRQQTKLSANDGSPWDLFGYSVSIHSNRIVVGAISHDSDDVKNSGAAYVFTRRQNVWGLETKLKPPVPTMQGFYGCSVDLHDNRLAVGAYGEDGEAGSVYVYRRASREDWVREEKYTETNKMAGNHFGWSVSTDGTNIVVGSRDSGEGGVDSGAAYIYLTENDVPVKRQLNAYNAHTERWFGRSVSIHNGRVVVGSYSDKLNNNGSVYVFNIVDRVEPTTVTWVVGVVIPALVVLLAAMVVFRFRVQLSTWSGVTWSCVTWSCVVVKERDGRKDENENVESCEEHMLTGLKPVSVRT